MGAGALAVGRVTIREGAPSAVDLGRLRLVATPVAAPPIVSRSEWGADESLRRGSPRFAPITRVIVHHTVTANHEPDPAARMRAIHEFHVRGNRWDDIGYNFVVDAAGRIYEGRSGGGPSPYGEDGSGQGVTGAHADGHNTGSVGIAVLGTFSGAGVVPTAAALDAVASVVAWKLGTRDLDPRAGGALIAHRDVAATGCPGEGLHRQLPELRQAAASRIAASRSTADDGGGLVEELLDALGGLLG